MLSAFEEFVRASAKVAAVPGSKPESSLYGPFNDLLRAFLHGLQSPNITQQVNAEAVGIPDYRIDSGNELLGWVELKAVTGKPLRNLRGHDLDQKSRFVDGLHNFILTNGWEWELYQAGSLVMAARFDPRLFEGDVKPLWDQSAWDQLLDLLNVFKTYTLKPYSSVGSAVTALALRAKALKSALIDLGPAGAGDHLVHLQSDFKSLLYKNGQKFTWERFVDSYVQIAAFGALLWRLEANSDISLDHQVGLKTGAHPLLHQCLSILWSSDSRVSTLEPLLEELVRTVNLVHPSLFITAPNRRPGKRYIPDPIVHAYEPFFAVYDSASREANGVFYTPVELVQYMVSGSEYLLKNTLGVKDGLLDPATRILDPATGTGTFLLGLANAAAHEAEAKGLPVDTVVRDFLVDQCAAFELFPGPYTIAHQRLEAFLRALGAPPATRLPIYLADTLAEPESGQLPTSDFGVAGEEIRNERVAADRIKAHDEVMVIIGNPPYERIKKANGGFQKFAQGLMDEVVKATPVEARKDLKSATDLYVAFWAWALWALRTPESRAATANDPEIDTRENHGIVSFVSNRTWILGPSLQGLRSLVRRGAKEIWVTDLGGDSRGGAGARTFAGGDQNVFAIQTGVAIVWAVFDREFTGKPKVHYQRFFGKKADKLTALENPFNPGQFIPVEAENALFPTSWPAGMDAAPRLSDLFSDEPLTGIQTARDKKTFSPVGTSPEAVYAEFRSKPTADVRHVGSLAEWASLSLTVRQKEWATASTERSRGEGREAPDPSTLDVKKVRPFLYRPLDVRYVYDDPKWIDWYREDLHAIYSKGPVPTLVTNPSGQGEGPTVIHTGLLMDQHSFNNRGGKAIFPLWYPSRLGERTESRSVDSDRRCSFSGPMMDYISQVGLGDGGAESWIAGYDYILGILSAPSYSREFWRDLEWDEPRIPLVADASLAARISALGQSVREAWDLKAPKPEGLRWEGSGVRSLGSAKFASGTISFSGGRMIRGVSEAAWNFSISTYPVLPRWFAARTDVMFSTAMSTETLQVVASVMRLVELGPDLDKGLLQVLEAETVA